MMFRRVSDDADHDAEAISELGPESNSPTADLDVSNGIASFRGNLEVTTDGKTIFAAVDVPKGRSVGAVRRLESSRDQALEIEARGVGEGDLRTGNRQLIDGCCYLRIAIAKRIAESPATYQGLLVGDGAVLVLA